MPSNNNSSSIKVAYFGAPASFSEEAALKYIELSKIKNYELIPAGSMKATIEFATRGDIAVIPYSNSYAGSVEGFKESYDHLVIDDIKINVHHYLLSQKYLELSDIRFAYSHPQAFAQCKKFLKTNLPNVELILRPSTSEASFELSNNKLPARSVVIASRQSATMYHLKILRSNIEDSTQNITSFKVLRSSVS